jgi:hypothetical protein
VKINFYHFKHSLQVSGISFEKVDQGTNGLIQSKYQSPKVIPIFVQEEKEDVVETE